MSSEESAATPAPEPRRTRPASPLADSAAKRTPAPVHEDVREDRVLADTVKGHHARLRSQVLSS